jgi:hypothetical protein
VEVESTSKGILGAVGFGRNFQVESESVKMYRLRPQSKILTRYSNSRALIATVTIRLTLNIGYKSKKKPDDSRGGDEMSYRFTVINTY